MWLFVPEGFFSIVTADELGHELQVRARSKEDLDRLRAAYLPSLGDPVGLPGHDYPWRAFTTRKALADGLAKVVDALDYRNFKDTVARRHSHERAHTYLGVWQACLAIEEETPPARNQMSTSRRPSAPVDRTAEYRGRDLHAEGVWPTGSERRYGGVVFNEDGEVLLREPAGHYDDYVWTFAKGEGDDGEHPVATALREVFEETGCRPAIVGHVPGVFTGGSTGSHNYFYVMYALNTRLDPSACAPGGETSAVRWATHDEARRLIGLTTNVGGRDRDLATLEAAFDVWDAMST